MFTHLHISRLTVSFLGGLLALLVAAQPALACGPVVLPPDARVGGYTLEMAARQTAVFNTSDHSNLALLPRHLPFQILYTDLATNNTFTVGRHTSFYVPVGLIDDSPPIIGTFPSSSHRANSYFFGRAQAGGRNFAITVDGKTTRLNPQYLRGPIHTPPLSDGGGRHYMVIAAFLAPLPRGSHRVVIRGEFSGAEVVKLFGGIYQFEIEYTVNVR